VFLCYNSSDRSEVREIGEVLKQHKLLPWFDEWELRPGVAWQTDIMSQIERVKKEPTKQFALFDEVLDYIDEIVIPTKLIL
jgi:hypothetical protein